jgi:hypothetical protein
LKPDAAFLRGCELYLIVEFESKGNEDYNRMRLYGASWVRWMCRATQLHYVLPMLYVFKDGSCKLLYMYEDENMV